MKPNPRDYISKRYLEKLNYLSEILSNKLILGKDPSNFDLYIEDYEGSLFPKCYYHSCNNHQIGEIGNKVAVLETEDKIERFFFHEECLDSLVLRGIQINHQ